MLSIREQDALSDFKFYYYEPSMAAAVIFIVLFGLSTALHFFQMIRTRTWFMIPFCIGGVLETVGYVGRALSAGQSPGPYTLGPYIIQSTLLLIAPALFAASVYMELGRIAIMLNGEDRLLVRRTWLTKTFVGGDVLSFLMQASGAGMMAGNTVSQVNTGQKVVVVGLIVQVLFFGLFVVASVLFHHRIHRAPTNESMTIPWKKHIISLYVVSILIFIRSIVRVVEYVEGFSGFVMTHEAFLYVFDALVMFCAVIIMNVCHPAEVAERIREKRFIKSSDGETLGAMYVSV